MTIVLDSNEYIYGLANTIETSVILLKKLSSFEVKIPRFILDELHNNLTEELLKELYKLIIEQKIVIFEEKVSEKSVKKFKDLPYEDAVIAAYCELLKVNVLVSENRHFLIGFHSKSFKVFSAKDFLDQFC